MIVSAAKEIGNIAAETAATGIDPANFLGRASLQSGLDETEAISNEVQRILGENIQGQIDILQADLIQGLETIISESQAQYAAMSEAQKNALADVGIFNEADYVHAQGQDYINNVIKPASEDIEDAFEQLGIDGAGWATDAGEKILEGLFNDVGNWEDVPTAWVTTIDEYGNEVYTQVANKVGDYAIELKEDWKEVFGNMYDDEVQGKVDEAMEQIAEGTVLGAEKNKDKTFDAGETMGESIIDGAEEGAGVHSPSWKMEEIAMWAVAGAVKGVNANKAKLVKAFEDLASQAVKAFGNSLQKGVNEAVSKLSMPKASSSGGMSGVVQGQMSAASSTLDTSMQEMFTDILPQYFEAGQWDGLFATLSSTLNIGLEGIAGSFDEWMTSFWNEHLTVWFEDSKLKEGIFTPLETNLDDEWTSLTTWFDTSMNKWWDEDLTPWFAADKWEPQFDTINTAADTGFQKVRRTIGDLLDKITDDVRKSCKKMGDDLKDISDSLKDTKELSNISVTVDAKGARSYATGGFVEDGYFFANHNELVGRFSNGRTAVANNAQIVAGIQAGVYAAVRDAMNDSGGTQVVIQGDTDRIFRVMQNKSRQYNRATGANAFA